MSDNYYLQYSRLIVMLSLLRGEWADWSCALSVAGELPLPRDLCPARAPSQTAFCELAAEHLYQLDAPALGSFVERRIAKLMPDEDLPAQIKSGRMVQVHPMDRSLVQDSHYDGTVWTLQTVMPGPMRDERLRLALMLDSALGELVRGMRVLCEWRCTDRPSLTIATDCVSKELSSCWLSAMPSGEAEAAGASASHAHEEGSGPVRLPAYGLTIRVSAGRLSVDCRREQSTHTIDRHFDGGGACYCSSETARARHRQPAVSAFAQLGRLRGGVAPLRARASVARPALTRRRALGAAGVATVGAGAALLAGTTPAHAVVLLPAPKAQREASASRARALSALPTYPILAAQRDILALLADQEAFRKCVTLGLPMGRLQMPPMLEDGVFLNLELGAVDPSAVRAAARAYTVDASKANEYLVYAEGAQMDKNSAETSKYLDDAFEAVDRCRVSLQRVLEGIK